VGLSALALTGCASIPPEAPPPTPRLVVM